MKLELIIKIRGLKAMARTLQEFIDKFDQTEQTLADIQAEIDELKAKVNSGDLTSDQEEQVFARLAALQQHTQAVKDSGTSTPPPPAENPPAENPAG